MIKDKTLKNIATVLSGLNCSTILTLEQVAWNRKRTKLIKEKSLYIMFFGFKNKKICFDVVFRILFCLENGISYCMLFVHVRV